MVAVVSSRLGEARDLSRSSLGRNVRELTQQSRSQVASRIMSPLTFTNNTTMVR